MTETNVCTLHINIPFNEWVDIFDKDEAPARAEKNIKFYIDELVKIILIKQ